MQALDNTAVTAEQVSACMAALHHKIGDAVRTDTYQRMLYATDASIYHVEPAAVVIPRHRDDLQAVLETASQFKVPVTARAAGSSLAGQAVGRGIIVDVTKHLDRILELDRENRRVTLEPGVVLDDLNRFLREEQLLFGPDPASSNRAAMGGIVSNNSTGSHSICYGMTADHVHAMDVVLADGSRTAFGNLEATVFAERAQRSGMEGTIYRGLNDLLTNPQSLDIIRRDTPRHWRRCGGYNLDRLASEGVSFLKGHPPGRNLARLLSGAEGTLGLIESVTLDLVPLPKYTGLAIVHFDDIVRALETVQVILEVEPSAVELLDHLGMSMCRQNPMWRKKLEQFVQGQPNAILITEFQGDSESEIEFKIDGLKRHLSEQGAPSHAVVSVVDSKGQNDVWSVRKMGLGFLMSVRGDHKPIPFIEDAAVPVEHLADYVTGVERFCNGRGLDVAYYAHASAGCVHIRPMVNTKAAEEIAHLPDIIHFAIDMLKGFGGALSSEHGDGRARSSFNRSFFGDDLYGLYEQTKQIFDPDGILNPGIITGAEPMTDHLRFGSDYRTQQLRTNLDFTEDLGYASAVEMCNGAGVCRKLGSGTMCPSFMATREEEHSTRGRANALRNVLNGRLDPDLLTGERLYETMDLCLQCKACKAECPSSVDMATIKIEFLDRYHRTNGTPLRTRFFARAAFQARFFSGWVAPLVNKISNHPVMRQLLEKTVGVSSNRMLPPFAAKPFTTWFRRHSRSAAASSADRKRVVLFNDTFNTYHYPDVARSATLFLEACGFEVILPGHRCCGRPAISKGLVDMARKQASQTLDKLLPFAEEGLPIIGLEPSCVLSFDDEYHKLLPGDPRVPVVAERAVLFDTFVASLDPDRLPAMSGYGEVLLHGHCHQKAEVGTGGTHAALGRIDGCSVNEIDSGCCGMAGSFGFEKEHYELSMQIGKQRLFPAVRETPRHTTVVAPGVSCRQQIAEGTGRKAIHPAELMYRAMLRAQETGDGSAIGSTPYPVGAAGWSS